MVLLAVADHKYRIEVGYGLEGILPDGKTGDIGRDMVPDLKASDYDGAVTLAVGEVAQVIADDAKITLNQDQPADAPPTRSAKQRRRWASSSCSSLCSSSLAESRCCACSLAPACSLAAGAEAVGGGGLDGGGFGGGGLAVGVAEALADSAAAAAVLAAAAPEEVGKSISRFAKWLLA